MTVPLIFDYHAVRLHRTRAVAQQKSITPLLEATADILLDRLDDVSRRFTSALDIGGRGLITKALLQRDIPVVSLDFSIDFSLAQAKKAPSSAPSSVAICADMDTLPFKAHSFDLVMAHLSLHWVNDLPGILRQICHILQPDGLFLASIPIVPTLQPLRVALEEAELALRGGVSPRISPLPTHYSCVTLMQRAGFALPLIDREVVNIRYRTLRALVSDLRAAGETNALTLRDRTPPPRALFPLAAATLENTEEGYFATPLHMAILSGWAPDPSQPQTQKTLKTPFKPSF